MATKNHRPKKKEEMHKNHHRRTINIFCRWPDYSLRAPDYTCIPTGPDYSILTSYSRHTHIILTSYSHHTHVVSLPMLSMSPYKNGDILGEGTRHKTTVIHNKGLPTPISIIYIWYILINSHFFIKGIPTFAFIHDNMHTSSDPVQNHLFLIISTSNTLKHWLMT